MTARNPNSTRKVRSDKMKRQGCATCGTPVPKARAKYCGVPCMSQAMRGNQRTPRVVDPIAHIRERCVITSSGCWEWQKRRNRAGYGEVSITAYLHVSKLVHIVTYTILVGPIPDGLELDHLCRNRACCNPEHLEAVTHTVNVQRAQRMVAS